MSKQKHFGKCALCGKECELTFEHIPPKAAFNKYPAKFVTGDTLLRKRKRLPWDVKGLPYLNLQQGAGLHTLCSTCNNNTGSWYGDSYISIAHIVQRVLSQDLPPDKNALVIKNAYPLRFIKQIVSMFCSVNPNIDIDELRQFVCNKDRVGIDKSKYRIHMYFTRSSMRKIAPFSVKVLTGNGLFLSSGISEITVPPMGFILYFDPSENTPYDGFDISGFADCKFDDIAELQFPLCVLEVNGLFPTDFRSKEEIIQTIEENEKWKKEHESEENI